MLQPSADSQPLEKYDWCLDHLEDYAAKYLMYSTTHDMVCAPSTRPSPHHPQFDSILRNRLQKMHSKGTHNAQLASYLESNFLEEVSLQPCWRPSHRRPEHWLECLDLAPVKLGPALVAVSQGLRHVNCRGGRPVGCVCAVVQPAQQCDCFPATSGRVPPPRRWPPISSCRCPASPTRQTRWE